MPAAGEPDRYAVIGNPVAHSRSPEIHAAFARQTSDDIRYERLLAPLDGFAATVAAFRVAGGRGANVTLPFKEEAFRLADSLSERAQAGGAVNTLRFENDVMQGDNTDGIGLVRDIGRLGCALQGKRVLMVGAGGAARGVVMPLVEEGVAALVIANRTDQRAHALASIFGAPVEASSFAALRGHCFDVVINATSSSIAGEAPALPAGIYGSNALAYDMMYARTDTPFMAAARREGARVCDGLGMLVEQAAEAFFIWRGVRPDAAPVLEQLRKGL
jgi:shikimate dehydrogenase